MVINPSLNPFTSNLKIIKNKKINNHPDIQINLKIVLQDLCSKRQNK